MKITIFTIIFSFLLLVTPLSASVDFPIEEVNRFAYCQNYYSNTTMDIEPPYMYALTSYGLEIYEIQDNGSLQKISELPIRCSYRLVRKDNFLYIGTYILSYTMSLYDRLPLNVYQVDISDRYNPQITKTLEFDNAYGCMIPVLMGDYFIAQAYWGPDEIYTTPDLEHYGTIPDEDMALITINDTLCVDYGSEISVIDLYNTSNITDFQYITSVNMYDYHGDYPPLYFQIINDTICVVAGQSAVSFWNISNLAQWEYISHYEPDEFLQNGINFTIQGDYIILFQFYGLELIDISDVYNPQSLDYCDFEGTYHYYITGNNDYIYVASWGNGMEIYHVEDNEIQFVQNYYEYPSFNYSTYLYNDHVFVESYDHGIYVFDVSDPLNPSEVITCLKDTPLRSPVGHDSLLVMRDIDDYTIKIYDISEPNNPILRNTIDDLSFMDWLYSVVRFDNSEPQSMYISDYGDGDVRKYDISQPGDCPLLFIYNITHTKTDFIPIEGYGYLYTNSTHPQKLYIIDGLYENNPHLVDTNNNFSNYQYQPFFRKCGDYICLMYSGWEDYDETYLYSVDDPPNPELTHTLEISSSNSWPEIYNNLLFTKTDNMSFVYDLNECNGDTLHYIDYFYGLFIMYGYDFCDVGNTHYLIANERSSVGVYEFKYSYAIDPDPEVNDHIFTSFPNPFTSSTKIQMSLTTDYHELSQIKIYNVKGQLVRALRFDASSLSRFVEIVWDGKDEIGRDVKSGVYLYKLSGNDKYIGKVVKLK